MRRYGSILRRLAATVGVALSLLACAAWGQSCSVSTIGTSFGNYDYVNGNSTSGTVTLGCSSFAVLRNVTVALSAGSGSGATIGNRLMSQQSPPGTDRLRYGLYQNATTGPLCAGGIVWGDTTATQPAAIGLLFITSGNPRRWTVYGCVPSGQDATVATYADTVVVTVVWN